MNDFCVFILSHSRAEKVITYETLRKSGYTGKIIILCSDDDSQLDIYKNKFDHVEIFKKTDYKNKFDIADNFNDLRVVVYARNAVFDIAKKTGFEYFLVLDDDYTDFRYKFDSSYKYGDKIIKKGLDEIFSYILKYYKSINAKSICFSQGGDFIGGEEGSMAKKIYAKRKIMNSFFCCVNRRFNFVGRINEDVNTYVLLGTRGELVFQTNQFALQQVQTQQNSGGLTEFYLEGGTYQKSFYSVLFAPSCVKIKTMGSKYKRLHHFVSWNNCANKILRESFKKP